MSYSEILEVLLVFGCSFVFALIHSFLISWDVKRMFRDINRIDYVRK